MDKISTMSFVREVIGLDFRGFLPLSAVDSQASLLHVAWKDYVARSPFCPRALVLAARLARRQLPTTPLDSAIESDGHLLVRTVGVCYQTVADRKAASSRLGMLLPQRSPRSRAHANGFERTFLKPLRCSLAKPVFPLDGAVGPTLFPMERYGVGAPLVLTVFPQLFHPGSNTENSPISARWCSSETKNPNHTVATKLTK